MGLGLCCRVMGRLLAFHCETGQPRFERGCWLCRPKFRWSRGPQAVLPHAAATACGWGPPAHGSGPLQRRRPTRWT